MTWRSEDDLIDEGYPENEGPVRRLPSPWEIKQRDEEAEAVADEQADIDRRFAEEQAAGPREWVDVPCLMCGVAVATRAPALETACRSCEKGW